MWIQKYEETFKGLKTADVWKMWADVDRWPEWHGDLEACKLHGPFAVGSYFMLTPKGHKAVRVDITEMQEGLTFTDCTKFPGARMYDMHRVEKTRDGVRIWNEVRVKGPLSWLWVKLVARGVAAAAPEETQALVRQVKAA